MAPYNTRGSKRKREREYQEARAAFGLEPAPMEEALAAERAHQAVAAAETAVAAEAFAAAFAGYRAAGSRDSVVASDPAADPVHNAGADAVDDAAFFNVSVDTRWVVHGS